jgi:uncharacterized protein (UPF0335 family)
MKKEIHKLACKITRLEGKKKSVSIAQVKEILGILADLIYDSPEIRGVIHDYAKTRYEIRQKKGR